MKQNDLFAVKNVLTVIFLVFILGFMAFLFSFWQTPDFKANSKLLVIFNQENIDTYTASRTANYVTGILSEAVYSESFIGLVFKNEPRLIDNLGSRSEIRQRNWKRTIKIKVLENRGIMIIDIFGDNRNQVALLADAVTKTIVENHGLYDGSQDRISIRVLDQSSIYENWALTKIIRDTLIGLIAGLILGLTFVIIFPNHRIFYFKPKRNFYTDHYQNQGQMSKPIRQENQNYNTTTFKNEQVPNNYQAKPNLNNNSYPEEESKIKTNNPWLEEYYEENLPNKLK
jgi:hypothetical protein